MATMTKLKRVYSCCGQYIAVANNYSSTKIYCPRCGQQITTVLRVPTIQYVSK